MSGAIEMKAYVIGGLVSAEVVDALLAFGEPMLTEVPFEKTRAYGDRQYRAWIRCRGGCGGRMFGPRHSTPQYAATALLEKLRGWPS